MFNFLKLSNWIFFIGIILFPFQNLTLDLFTSKYDYSAFLLALYSFLINFSIKKEFKFHISFNKNYLFFVLSVAIFQVLIWFFYNTPFYRLISGFFWSIGLFSIILFRNKVDLDITKVFFILLITIIPTACFLLFESFTLLSLRPKAFFDEPSYAGLIMYSTSFGFLGCVLSNKFKTKMNTLFLLLFFIFFFIGLVTRSLHFVSLFLALFIFLINYPKKVFYFIPLLILFFLFFLLLNYDLEDFKYHIFSRLNLSFGNLSTITWLFGFDQALYVLFHNPFTGYGLGSTGFFEFYSKYNDILFNLGHLNQNRFDSYSLLFRFIIELGFFVTFTLLLFLLKCLRNIFDTSNIDDKKQITGIIFLRFFSICLVTGLLIKEPVYSRSICYLGFVLLAISFKNIIFFPKYYK